MALSKLTITYGEWKKINAAGESGKAWLGTIGDDGSSRVIVAHTDSGQSPTDDIEWDDATDLDRTIGYTLPQTGNPINTDILAPDNISDVYYATLLDEGETCTLIVDFA